MITKKPTTFLSNQISRTALSHVKPPHRLSVSSFQCELVTCGVAHLSTNYHLININGTTPVPKFMEPSGAVPISPLSEEFQRVNFHLQSFGQQAAFKLEQLFTLRTPRHADQFNRFCNDQKSQTVYLDVEQYAAQHKVSIDELFGTGFDALDPHEGYSLQTSAYEPLQSLKNAQTKYTQQKYTALILEALVAPGVPMVVENGPDTYVIQNLQASYDSFAVIPKNSCQVGKQNIQHEDAANFSVEFKVFQKERLLPQRLLIVSYDCDLGKNKQYCQVCLHCVDQNITRYQYFNKPQQLTTDKQQQMKPNLAELFCKNDDMALCRECDKMLHTQLLSAHTRTDISHQTKLDKCQIHPDQFLRFYDHVAKKYYCQKCLTNQNIGQTQKAGQNIQSVEDVFFEIQKEFATTADISDLQQQLVAQQNKLGTQIAKVQQFSFDLEQLLVNYFKQMVSNLQFNVQLFIQQILGQDIELQNIYKKLTDTQVFMTTQQQYMSTNQYVTSYYIFKEQFQQFTNQIIKSEDFVNQFIVGIEQQINQFKNQYQQQPKSHLAQIKEITNSYTLQRLYGLYGRVPRSEMVTLSQDGGMNQIIFRQLYNQKQQTNPVQRVNEQLGDEEVMKLFSAVGQNEKLFQFSIGQTPAYEAIKKNTKLLQQKDIERKLIEETERQMRETERKMQASQSYQPAASQQPMDSQQQQNNVELSKILSADEKQAMFSSVSNLKQQRNYYGYLDEIFNDKKQDKNLHGVTTVNNEFQQQKLENVNELFDSAVKGLRRKPERWDGVAGSPQQQQQIINSNNFNNDVQQPDFATTTRLTINQPEPEPIIQAEPSPVAQKNSPEPINNDVQSQNLTQQFQKLLQIYKIREKNVALPTDVLAESNLSQELSEQLLLQSLHALSKARGFSKLKLLEPQLKFDKRRGNKFAALLAMTINRPTLVVLSLGIGSEYKQICLFVAEDFNEGQFQGRWNQLLDLTDQTIFDQNLLEIHKKFWKFGEVLYVYKDFHGAEYQGKSWNVESVEAYVYEWK
ncbi:Conserved_hypothetical protein [Hexamita inflata]|uniref:B box-type domain-containing protein n=2 Tax=Hexamita inflata TaxID=28002 RepID=A0AA86V405_9EUKA|nr:Conserved hypothetical protein [Hexamita inflata]